MHKHFAVAVIFNIATFMIGITLTFNEVSVVYALSCKFDTNMYNGELFHIVTPAVCIELKICKTMIDARLTCQPATHTTGLAKRGPEGRGGSLIRSEDGTQIGYRLAGLH